MWFALKSSIGGRVATNRINGRRVGVFRSTCKCPIPPSSPTRPGAASCRRWQGAPSRFASRCTRISVRSSICSRSATPHGSASKSRVTEVGVQELIDRAARERANGVSVTYVITLAAHAQPSSACCRCASSIPAFEAAEWECTLAPSSRGTGVFLEAARLVGSFAFGTLGTHRLEARVLLQNGRANGALRKLGAVQEGVLRRSVRRARRILRSGALVDAERGLGRALGLDGAARALMNQLPRRCALLRQRPSSRIGVALLAVCLPHATFDQPLLFLALLAAVVDVGLAEGLPAADHERLDDVGVVRGRLRVAAAARPARDDARRRRQRLQPVQSEQQGAQPALSHAVQHGVARRDRAGRRPGVSPARRRRDTAIRWTALARPLVGAATVVFPPEHRAGRDGDRAVDARRRSSRTWHNNFLWSAPSYFVGAGSAALAAVVRRPRRLLGGAAHLRAALSHLPHLQGLHGPHRGRAAARAADLGPAPGDDRSAGARDRRQGSDDADRTSGACRSTPPGWRRRSGCRQAEIQGVKTAALLHDIGKLAVPEHILSKPGPLTQEEFQKIRIHPQVGAEIIAAVPFPYPVAPLILSHHERWDGKGYPQGLAGEDIPIGARILTIVDYYDAVTTRAAVSQGAQPRQRDRPAEARSGARARSAAGARCSSRCCRRSIAELGAGRAGSRSRRSRRRRSPGRRRSGLVPARRAERVREHRAGAPRDLRAVRDRAVDGHQPRRGRHDGADLVEADEDHSVVGLRAVPAAARRRHARSAASRPASMRRGC